MRAVARIRLAPNPVTTFAAASLLFGSLIILATPPLRGPDETAHFLRAYGAAAGDIIPSLHDEYGRKGVLLPPRLHAGFDYFDSVFKQKGGEWFGYGPVFQAYFDRAPVAVDSQSAPTFVPYGGSEGYSPIAYLPQTAAAAVARALDLDFIATLYLMRFAGLAAMTGLIAFAIAMTPQLAWALVAITMLPAALYGRSVISADGTALATATLVTALWLRGIMSARQPARDSFWMMLSALTKPTNLAFVLLELATLLERPARRWRLFALMVLPATVAALLWSFGSGADTATWRVVELTGHDAAAFGPAARLAGLIDDPTHFPAAVMRALSEKDFGELWRQVIGVLGMFDTVLQRWVYPAVSVLLFATFLTRLPLAGGPRVRIAAVAGVTAASYAAAVYLVCYLAFTPPGADTVWGVQGRYFVPILPLAAIIVAALFNRALDKGLSAALAISAALLSGAASVAAIIEVDWKF